MDDDDGEVAVVLPDALELLRLLPSQRHFARLDHMDDISRGIHLNSLIGADGNGLVVEVDYLLIY